MWQIGQYVRYNFDDRTLHYGFGSIHKVVRDLNFQTRLLGIHDFLKVNRSNDELLDYADINTISDQELVEVMSFLRDGRFLINPQDFGEDHRYSRN